MRGRDNYERVKNIVNTYVQAYKELPTVRELAMNAKISTGLAGIYLKRMEEEGLVVSRGVGGGGYVGIGNARRADLMYISRRGTISCGYRKLAVEEIEDYIALPQGSLGPGEYFALTADGNSMINAGIVNGDYVIIRKQDWADPGQIVVALVDREEATLKRYYPHPEEGYIDLVAENPEVPVQRIPLDELEPFTIQGVAVKVLHNLEKRQCVTVISWLCRRSWSRLRRRPDVQN